MTYWSTSASTCLRMANGMLVHSAGTKGVMADNRISWFAFREVLAGAAV